MATAQQKRSVFFIGFHGADGICTGGPREAGERADLESLPLDQPQPARVDELTVRARTSADLRRVTVLDHLLPAAPVVQVIIEEIPDWRQPPLPSPGDEALWFHLRSAATSREGERGWCVRTVFDLDADAGTVVAAVVRMLEGHRLNGGALLAASAGPGAVQKRSSYATADLLEPLVKRTELVAMDLSRQAGRHHGVPLDERSVNPIGFDPGAGGPVAVLEWTEHGPALTADGCELLRPESGSALTDADIARLRWLRGIRLAPLPSPSGDDEALARLVVSCAAAGIPLTASSPHGWSSLLGETLALLIAGVKEEELSDPLTREEHSIRQRRHALRHHGMRRFWLETLREWGHMQAAPLRPSVSVLLCTKRPELVDFALRQIARQRGVDMEVVLALHGVPWPEEVARRALANSSLRIVPVTIPAHYLLGEALNTAAARASGSYIAKMDDDDWYGPDHLGDALLAQAYSGADVVGCPQEFVYLESLDMTVRRRRGRTETPCALTPEGLLPGGTLVISRTALEGVGGFRAVARFEDTELSNAVRAAGGRAYRMHGLNYLYRRRAPSMHTYTATNDHFLKENSRRWAGRFFNQLMEADSTEPYG
ncbi:glycosyltransferase [Nonomuraea glycinis]|uniref:glycosyltransferase n=1 Tax=Nonomuraea glycinis TaxID=2047744 RepID=UPI0033B5BBF6